MFLIFAKKAITVTLFFLIISLLQHHTVFAYDEDFDPPSEPPSINIIYPRDKETILETRPTIEVVVTSGAMAEIVPESISFNLLSADNIFISGSLSLIPNGPELAIYFTPTNELETGLYTASLEVSDALGNFSYIDWKFEVGWFEGWEDAVLGDYSNCLRFNGDTGEWKGCGRNVSIINDDYFGTSSHILRLITKLHISYLTGEEVNFADPFTTGSNTFYGMTITPDTYISFKGVGEIAYADPESRDEGFVSIRLEVYFTNQDAIVYTFQHHPMFPGRAGTSYKCIFLGDLDEHTRNIWDDYFSIYGYYPSGNLKGYSIDLKINGSESGLESWAKWNYIKLFESSEEPEDKIPPTTTHKIEAESDPGKIRVTLTATDDSSGVARTYFSTDDGDWIASSTFWIDLYTTDTIKYYSVDEAGNNEEIQTINVQQNTYSSAPKTGVLYSEDIVGGKCYLVGSKYHVRTDLVYYTLDDINIIDRVTSYITVDDHPNIDSYFYSNFSVISLQIYHKTSWWGRGELIKERNHVPGGWHFTTTYTANAENLWIVDTDEIQLMEYHVKITLNSGDGKNYLFVNCVPTFNGFLAKFSSDIHHDFYFKQFAMLSSMETGSINQDEVLSSIAHIDSLVSEVTFSVYWEGSDIDLVLYTPDGIKITPESANINTNISFFENATNEYYTLKNPQPGDWTMEVTGIDVPSGGEKYITVSYLKSDLSLSLSTDKNSYEKNENMRLSADLTKEGVPMPGAFVEALIQNPDGSIHNMILYDDGTHSDNVAGDGNYSNIYANLATPGNYNVNVFANVTINGEQFERAAYSKISVNPIIIASAGGPYAGTVGSSITFDASNSSSMYGDIISYEWDLDYDGIYEENLSCSTLSYTYSSEYFGLVKVRVTNNDGLSAIGAAYVEVIDNQQPISDAGPDQAVQVGDTVTLDGSGSTDPDGDLLTYTWTWDGGSATGVNPSIQLPLGLFTITLIVNDGTVDSDPDTVNINVVEEQRSPGDLDGDGDIDSADYNLFRSTLGKCGGDAGFIAEADYDEDGCVTYADYRIWYGYYRNQ